MTYDRLRPTASTGLPDPNPIPSVTRRRWFLLLAAAIFLVAASSAITVAIVRAKQRNPSLPTEPTRAITMACGQTQYPALCVESLVEFPGAVTANRLDELVPISVNMTLKRVGQALWKSSEIRSWEMDSFGRSAYEDCIELLDNSVYLLTRSLASMLGADDGSVGVNKNLQSSKGSRDDVMTWLSGALTNQGTCTDGLSLASGPVKIHMSDRLRNLTELVSNSLAIYAATYGGGSDFSGVPIQNRRLMSFSEPDTGFPSWVSRSDRVLLEATPAAQIQADVVVSKDGANGAVKTIQQAIKMAPLESPRRFIIYVKAGRYVENELRVGIRKTNIWLIGDGMGRTVIAGHKSVRRNNITTFNTATFAATGMGFVAKDITFVNDAGPENHQAVALRVGADTAVVYRCAIKGYQDTLYTHSLRQFYSNCNIYGTVDFIFGNAAAVLQRCNIFARKPMAGQKNAITAQGRYDKNQNTGISIHECQIKPAGDLIPVKGSYQTFLGRPWKDFSTVVYMMSYLGDHIDPKGWLEWSPTAPVDKLYYGEFMNHGPRADTSGRVKWPGVHPIMSQEEANKFTVAQFIDGPDWLTPTGVAFQAGLRS